MFNEWMYIRDMFEQQYTAKESFFECTKEDVENDNSCICIPAVAVNYIANEIKFWRRKNGGKWKLSFVWDTSCEAYIAEKEANDWNDCIYDLKSHGMTCIDESEICTENTTEYTYIKIRNFANLEVPDEKPREMLYSWYGSGESKTEIELYTVFARDIRMEFPMQMYIDKLFRFLFFLHPLTGLEIMKRNLKQCDDENLKCYHKKLLNDYQILIEALQQFPSREIRKNLMRALRLIEIFVGAKILTIYVELRDSDEYGSIQNVNELFLERVHNALQLGSRGSDSRINKFINKYLRNVCCEN